MKTTTSRDNNPGRSDCVVSGAGDWENVASPLLLQQAEFRRSLPDILARRDPPLDPKVYPGPHPALVERWHEDGLTFAWGDR